MHIVLSASFMAPWKSWTATVHINALTEKHFHSAGKWSETGHLGITLAAILYPTRLLLISSCIQQDYN